jgi:hypothetical protein
MIKPAALVLAVAMAGVTAGTYYGLDLLPPGTLPPPIGRMPPPEPPKLGATQGGTGAAGAPSTPAATAPAPAKPAEEAVTEQDLAEEPPPPTQTASAAPSSPPAPAAAPAPAAPAPSAPPPPKPAAVAEDKPDSGWAKESAPAAKPAAPAAAAATPSAPPETPAPSAEPTQTAKAESATEPEPGPVKPKPPEADAIKPWWPNPEKMPANQLKLQYAGQVQGQLAIALLFSSPVNIDTVKRHAKIQGLSGNTVGGEWELGKNPRLAVFRGVDAGRYTVILSPEIADAKGFALGTTLQGPVYIQKP